MDRDYDALADAAPGWTDQPLLERDDPAAVRRHVGAGRADDAAVEADLARVGA